MLRKVMPSGSGTTAHAIFLTSAYLGALHVPVGSGLGIQKIVNRYERSCLHRSHSRDSSSLLSLQNAVGLEIAPSVESASALRSSQRSLPRSLSASSSSRPPRP